MRNLAASYGGAALITGASSGIGAEFAHQLADAGFDLILVARRQNRLEALSQDLHARTGVRVTVVATDLAAPGAVDDLIERTANLDIGLVVANAGTMVVGAFADNDYLAETATVQLNTVAVMQLTHRYSQRMTRRGRGALILVSSLVGQFAAPYSANYAATKAYVSALGLALHSELKPAGVDVLTLAPGPTDTEGMTTTDGFDASKLPMPMMSTTAVVRVALKRLGRRSLVIPGALNRFTDFLGTRVLGRRVMTALFGYTMSRTLRPAPTAAASPSGQELAS
jgi:uncharacterized protein